ncbi:uncharacterized protein J7T54_002736 [Emericellopsis cladophorae]|uniref:Non-reducing end beta-L-arabinofuranosidase n=1 Tax=Emericellopsis cladophorae TaxID=2686198 RepID=A0A9P9XU89_9HYPO|nr:uncharacterized protein J7T54_002736 [Emericellopsis cladophorae]KAI6777663.1 hypothetical protein J7T54_002736 [Emericellopsis cladophorae]
MPYPQVTYKDTVFNGPSLLKRQKTTISQVTVKAQLKQLRDSGRYDCFKLQWHPVYDDKSMWPVPKSLFWDSDIGKWIEGACYLLFESYDAEVDTAVRELVDMIRSAQQEDGYLNVYFTVVEPDARWSNIRDQHELYNAGHLIEGALAHREYYKNDLLMEPILKYVKLIRSVFGPGQSQRHAYPGHPEIELALLRLYHATGEQDAYDLAQYFIEERGNPNGQDGQLYYDWEEKQRGDSPWMRPDPYPVAHAHWYNQAHAPILQQKTIEGHSVRAVYLLIAVADLVVLDETGGKPYRSRDEYLKAAKTLWDNMVDKKMYVTGGVGAISAWEGFGRDYFLPQGTNEGGCYAETCASIAVMMLAERMLHLELDSRYADIMELCLYNAVMTAMSLDGREFTYVNQLASSDEDKSVRHDWFECACCPPNLMRLFGSLGGYLWDYGYRDRVAHVNVHLYTTAKVEFDAGGEKVTLEQETNWPWDGNVSFRLVAPSSVDTVVRLRLPAWSRGEFTLSPPCHDATAERGYLTLPSSYTSKHGSFEVTIHGFEPRHLSPHPYTNQNSLAMARGPIIYCVEDADHPWEENHFRDVVISDQSQVTEEKRTVDGTDEHFVALRTVGWIRDMGVNLILNLVESNTLQGRIVNKAPEFDAET